MNPSYQKNTGSKVILSFLSPELQLIVQKKDGTEKNSSFLSFLYLFQIGVKIKPQMPFHVSLPCFKRFHKKKIPTIFESTTRIAPDDVDAFKMITD